MTSKPLLAAALLVAGLATSTTAEDDKLARVDLPKLLDPATREGEVRALLDRHETDSSTKRVLKGFRVVACPQANAKETLHALLIDSDYVFESSFTDPDEYHVEKAAELFPAATPQPLPTAPLSPPGLERLHDQWLIVFDPQGREIRPFGGNNMISDGCVADFNHDGIVDRIDTLNCGIADGFSVRVVEVQSFERKSRTLLNVLYDWHPDEADEENAWAFECFDEENDGFLEIGFGPKEAERKREVVFRWNQETQTYLSAELPKQQRVKVLPREDAWAALKKLKAAGGHKYPLTRKHSSSDPTQAPPPYQFQSLRGASDDDIVKFMGGKGTPNSFSPEDAPPTTLPNDFWQTDPKTAALAFVDVNRMPARRKTMRLAIDDRGGIQPPADGWIVYDASSAACYTATRSLTVVRFGIAKPYLFHYGSSRNGVVTRNPLADRTGYTMRLAPLAPAEATRISQSLFWLDRVRSDAPKSDHRMGGMGSTADGFGSLDWVIDGQPPRRTEATLWATNSIASRFRDDYNRETCLNFSDHLLTAALPAFLGPRWDNGLTLEHRNLATPLTERLKPRADSDARDQLADIALESLTRHQTDPWPADALVAVAECVGEYGLSRALPALQTLARTLPPATPEEIEFKKLAEKIQRRPFDPDENAEAKRERARHQTLEEKFRYNLPCQLREPLARVIRQLEAIDDPARLINMANAGDRLSAWALQQLQLQHPDAYTDVLIARFHDADHHGRKVIFSTLAAAHPPGARKLRASLTAKQQSELAIELAEFEEKDEPELARTRVPALLEILRDSSGQRNWQELGPAIELLADLPLDPTQSAKFESLLLAELKKPRRDELRMSVLGYVIRATAKLPDPGRHWDALVAAGNNATDFGEIGELTDTLAALALAKPEPGLHQFAAFLKPRFTRSQGLMNDLFQTALALDLRELAPDIAKLANTGPDVPDGEGARSWGGNFEGPGHQRYHTARHVTALWLESDPDTLARMWAALFVHQPHEFQGPSAIATALRERFGASLAAASEPVRTHALADARAAAKDYPDLAEWLNRSGTPAGSP